MRYFAALLLFLAAPAWCEPFVTISTAPDGVAVAYDLGSKRVENGKVRMAHEVRRSTPACTNGICTSLERWIELYDCQGQMSYRQSAASFDADGKEIARYNWKPLYTPIRDTDATGMALFRAACSARRRAG